MNTLKKYYFEITANRLHMVEALDEEMALAYKKLNDNFFTLRKNDKTLHRVKFSENENTCTTEGFCNVPKMNEATKFLDDFIGTEYEIEEDCITVFDMTFRDYHLFSAYLYAYQW